MKKSLLSIFAMGLLFTACHNGDSEFSDFDYQTVYFANQRVGRTVELGSDREIDVTLDNERKVNIKAVLAGVYKNKSERVIHVAVDGSLCDNLYFTSGYGGGKVELLPSNYYTLESNTISILPGSIDGGVIVKLNESFFNDPKSLKYCYALPLVMTKAEGVDSILEGRTTVANPNRVNPNDWSVQPKDYTLYFLKFVNEWHGNYLRRGEDRISDGANSTTIKRHKEFVERDEEVSATTSAYRECILPLSTQIDGDHKYSYKLKLTFNEEGACTVSAAESGFTVSGTGKFVVNGEKNSIGGSDRDGLYLDYTVSNGSWTVATLDTLVMRNRNVKAEYPDVELK